ncbi:hypothetical protein C8R44DRAFT_852105 [Mycena epipterygia]|nr:hypothetical protein C8R44DRAFT_852105 [Mycena epipterygia]
MSAPNVDAPPVLEKPEVHQYSFPPFPVVPEGVEIIPFKDFKERGIQVQVFDAVDDTERDGLGIPTVALRVKHDTDVSKTNPDRKKKKEAARFGFKKEWWEDWEEGEDLRNHGPYNANVARVDRFHQAASDFQRYRKFPPMYTNVQWLWDQFRIFSGLLGTTPVWQKASEKAAADDDDDVSEDDEDDEDSKSLRQGAPGEKRYPPRPRPRAPYELYGKAPVIVGDDNDEIRGLIAAARATKEERVGEFLNDPARGITVFLSSYMRNQGMMWAPRNLTSTPHLLRFFVNYLLRNHVLPDKTSDRSLRSALEVISLAGVQLPLTEKISQALPDEFSMACQSCWGRKADSSLAPWSDSEEVDSMTGEPEAKRVKGNPDSDDAVFESILKEENVEMIKKEDILAPVADVAQEADGNAPAAGEEGADAQDEWDPSTFTPPTNGDETWGAASPKPETDWAPPALPSLLALLGPTTLPLTHAPGIVEWSVRRIRSIAPPLLPSPPPPPATGTEEWAPDPEAVERGLEARMCRVVMAPWLEWDGPAADPALSQPQILRSSVGALAVAVAVDAAAATTTTPAEAPVTTTTLAPAPTAAVAMATATRGPKPHDMLKDEITLLVDPAHANKLCVGMGLGGTWVQLARLQDSLDISSTSADSGGKPKKKKALSKAQKERRGLRYWYLDELMMTLPSYWVV